MKQTRLTLLALALITAVLLFVSSTTAATPGLPFTEDFSDTTLQDPLLTNANWSTAEQALILSWRQKQFGAFGAGLTSSDTTADAQAMPMAEQAPTPDGLTAADWAAIQSFLPSDYLKASNTGVSDQFGLAVAVSGDTVVVGASREDSSTTGVNSTPNEGAIDAGAAYVFVRTGGVWSQQAYLKASNTGADDNFGVSVAVSGDTVVVGAYGEDSSTTGVNSTPNEGATDAGAAYVFVRSGGTWGQQAYLKASNTGASDQFGWSVAVSGDTAVVGANGEASSTTGVNSTPNDAASNAGAAYVFVRSSGTWSQQAYLKASNTGVGDQFSRSVAVSGDMVVAGANWEDSSTTGVNSTPDEGASDAGAAYVFGGCVRSAQSGGWTDTATWVGGVVPTSSDGVCVEDGHTVALSGNAAIDQLWVYQGGTLDVGTHTLTVERSVSNEGTLRQTRTVNNANVEFLHIQNAASPTITQYRGVDIAAGVNGVNLGQTVVEVRGNAAVCNNNDGGAYRNRCFMVNPTNPGTVDITLHTTPGEDDVSDDAFFKWASGTTWTEGTVCADGVGVGGACTGSATFASPAWFLVGSAGNDPTAVALSTFNTSTPTIPLLALTTLFLLLLSGSWLLSRRRP